jgi:PQQ-like domain
LNWRSPLLRTKHNLIRTAILLFGAASVFGQSAAVLTYHNNNDRTGVNQSETALSPSTVSEASFGKLFSMPVDGQVYAQPLFVPAVSIGGVSHNVVYVATENNSVYAFDADNVSGQVLWQVNFGTPITCAAIPGCNRDLKPNIGITSTPVIDQAQGSIYVVAETYVSNTAAFYLHALNYTNGKERAGSPVLIAGSVAGTAPDSSGGKLAFNALMHWQRAGLLELNGGIYIGFAGHEDTQPYHGWLFGYDAVSLRRVLIKCLTPNGSEGGIWQGGGGLAGDASGNVYVSTGNGTFDADTGGSDYGLSVVKMDSVTGMLVALYFTPSNFAELNEVDDDIGSTGTILLPGELFAVAGCKDGRLFLMSTSNLGGYSAVDDSVAQEWFTAGPLFGDPVFYNNLLYAWARASAVQVYQFNGAGFDGGSGGVAPVMQGSTPIPSGYSNEPAMSISADGNVSGTAILWATWSSNGGSDGLSYQGVIAAYDASNLNLLWRSDQNSSDDLGGWAKWNPPTIVNGKVYAASFGNINLNTPGNYAINVYGLLGN